jgi:hypothetical protein
MAETMECRQCGTEIAANALICFRCGAATDEPEQPAADSRPAGRLWAPIFLGVVLLLAAGFFANLAAAGRPVSPAVWLMLGAAAVLLTWRLRK